MSNKTKSFLYLAAFITSTILYHIIKRNEVDPTPQIAKVEVVQILTIAGFD